MASHMKYIIDTNIMTAIIKDDLNVKEKVIDVILRGHDLYINAITYYEIKRGLLVKDAYRQMEIFETLCNEYELVLFDDITIFDNAAEIYANLRKEGITIEDADILIASLANTIDCILVTNNIRHFEDINGLIIENWIP